MGLSLAFHIIFAAIGIGLPVLMVIAEGMYLRTSRPVYLELAKRWARGSAILFAVGAVSGTVLSFELGLLWPSFMAKAGGIIGMPFSLEGTFKRRNPRRRWESHDRLFCWLAHPVCRRVRFACADGVRISCGHLSYCRSFGGTRGSQRFSPARTLVRRPPSHDRFVASSRRTQWRAAIFSGLGKLDGNC